MNQSLKPSTKQQLPERGLTVKIPRLGRKSPQMLDLKLGDGTVIQIRKFAPRLKPEFAALMRAHAKSLQTGFAKAVREAKRRNVPLSTILPVS